MYNFMKIFIQKKRFNEKMSKYRVQTITPDVEPKFDVSQFSINKLKLFRGRNFQYVRFHEVSFRMD
jgi:hypothetical protein